MTRIETYLDAGYVPTPPALLSAIAAQVAPSANPRAMLADFFCGQGEAAAAIGEALGVSYTLGVEIHKERAQAARQRLDRVICEDSLSGIMGSHGVFDVCFHNPPYAQNLQGDSAKYKRLEYQASLCVSPYIRPDGLLIAVLPGHRVTGEPRFIDLFSNHYDVLRVFAFPPDYFEAYRQVVIYARRRLLPRTDGGGREFARILRGGAPPLPETCSPDERIALPEAPITKRWFYRGREMEVDLMAREVAACEWSGARRFDAMLRPPEQTRIGYPAMPLKKTHIGSMIAASVLNNALLRRGRELNLIVARNPKRQKEKVVENNRDDDGQRVPVRVTEEFATECVAFNPRTGVFQQFSAGEPEAFYAYIQRWLDPLVENILTNFPPLYTFNFRETFPQWAVEYIDHYVATRAEIPGRARRGLFEGQKHVVAAMFLKLLEQLPGTHRQRGFFLLGGQTGLGKTFSAIALMGLLARLWAVETGHQASAPGWPYFLFVTEPTLLEQMRDEVKKGDPLLRPKIVTDVAEVSAFLAEAATTPWPMVLITSRTALKDGCGTAPAVVERPYHYRDRDTGQINSEPRFHCPACGAIQTAEVKEDEEWLELPVTDISYFQNTYRTCVACGGALWQQARQFGHAGYRASYAECATHWEAAAELRGSGPEPLRRIAAAVSQTRVLEVGEVEFKLETGDQLVLYDGTLVVRRGVPVVAALDTRAWTLTTDRAALARWPHRLSQRPLPAGTRLWQVPSPKKALLNPPPARLAVVEHLRRLAKHGRLVVGRDGRPVRQRVKALLGVVDELHTYKAEDSNAGAALAHLVEAAHKIVGLTATPYGGYASNLFGIEYRTNPEFRRRWPHDGLAEFTRRFGLFDWIERRHRSYASGYQGYGGYSAMSGVARKKERLRELPAASPELVASLLDHYLFVGFADLGIQMVPRTEHPVLVEPEEDFEKAYRAFAGEAASALRAAKDDRVNLAGSIHQALRVYAAAPWRAAHVRDRTGRVWAWGPDLEMVCPNCGRTLFKDAACDCAGEPVEGVKRQRVFARERALLDQLQAAQAAHRPSIVYVLHTGELDIVTGRWVGPGSLCEAYGIKAVDGRGWASAKRQARMEQAVLSGADAVFINPQRVALGMNLTAFCNCHFYQVADQFALMVQAFARPWRPTQTQPVEGYYHAARGTLEQTVLKRHARKLYAALLVHGDPLQSALFDDEDEADFDLLRQLTELMQDKHVEDLGAMFAQYNAAIEQTTSPAGYIGGYQIEVEARDFERRERVLESRLEAALEVETPALPAELPRSGTQLSLFV